MRFHLVTFFFFGSRVFSTKIRWMDFCRRKKSTPGTKNQLLGPKSAGDLGSFWKLSNGLLVIGKPVKKRPKTHGICRSAKESGMDKNPKWSFLKENQPFFESKNAGIHAFDLCLAWDSSYNNRFTDASFLWVDWSYPPSKNGRFCAQEGEDDGTSLIRIQCLLRTQDMSQVMMKYVLLPNEWMSISHWLCTYRLHICWHMQLGRDSLCTCMHIYTQNINYTIHMFLWVD